eukprot:2460835-Karenia_brevis.AAC.1
MHKAGRPKIQKCVYQALRGLAPPGQMIDIFNRRLAKYSDTSLAEWQSCDWDGVFSFFSQLGNHHMWALIKTFSCSWVTRARIQGAPRGYLEGGGW